MNRRKLIGWVLSIPLFFIPKWVLACSTNTTRSIVLDGKVIDGIDECIADMIVALNAAGIAKDAAGNISTNALRTF